MNFYDELQAATVADRNAFLSIPLIKQTVQRGASRELYVDYLTQAYHHVKHTYPLLALASSRTDDEPYQDALIEYMKEERGHEKWILDDIRTMGGNPDAVRIGKPGQACTVMVGYTYYAIEHVSPYAMLGSVHVLEGISTMLADQAATAIQSSLTFPGKDGFTYLRSHGALDIEHVAFFKALVNNIASDTHEVIIDTSKIIYQLYGDIFRELEMRHFGKRDAA